MNFNFYMPAKIISGENCILNNIEMLKLGKSCIIVTGGSSAIKCGALDDVLSALGECGIEYIIYDKVRENPLLSTAYDGGIIAREFGCDFVIGIGGGSPIDAAKAIAAFAANPEIEPIDIFSSGLTPSLPIVAVPTTAGTGSEANRYSVLSIDGEDKKKSFVSDYSYPKLSFLDPRYTYSLPDEYSMSTALDAFCHCLESFLSPKATEISKCLAKWGACEIWKAFDELECKAISHETREKLLYASCAAGIAINITGTGFPHPMGYNLTFHDNVPHGRACAVFASKFIEYQLKCDKGGALIYEFSSALGVTPDTLAWRMESICGVKLSLDEETVKAFADKVKDAGNFANGMYKLSYDEMITIYKDLFVENAEN